MKHLSLIIFVAILIFAAALRFTGLNWDSNAHLQPDERFLTMVTVALDFPTTIAEYFDTNRSPFNPHNKGFSFFVYGTYPMHIIKLIAVLIGKDTYNDVTIVGRTVSGILDIATVALVFLIGGYLAKSASGKFHTIAGLLSALCYALATLPVQLSHFYTVDPFVTFFVTLSLLHMIRRNIGLSLGVAAGLAVSAKVSAILLLPLIGCAVFFMKPRNARLLTRFALFLVAFTATIRVSYPYLFSGWTINQLVLDNWKQLASFDGPSTSFPPGIQWIGVPWWQVGFDAVVWGLGIPLGIFACMALIWSVRGVWSNKHRNLLIPFAWTTLVLSYQAFQFAKPMRYVWPAYPALAILTGIFLTRMLTRVPAKFHNAVIGTLILLLSIWPASFVSIYQRTNTRVQATKWMHTNIPKESTIAWEHWDDPLPFPMDGYPMGIFRLIQLPSFDPDDQTKSDKLRSILSAADYLVISSNRGYGALYRARTRFPIMAAFYQKLFAGNAGFTLVAQFASRPTIPIPTKATCIRIPGFTYGVLSQNLEQCDGTGVTFVDDYADESFTVYDHPKVLIFKKIGTPLL